MSDFIDMATKWKTNSWQLWQICPLQEQTVTKVQRNILCLLILLINRWISTFCIASRAPDTIFSIAWEGKRHNQKYWSFLLSLLLSFHCRAQYHMSRNIPLFSCGQLSRLHSFQNARPLPTHFRAGKGEKVKDFCARLYVVQE